MLELMIVVTIMGLAAGYTLYAYKGVTTEQRFRSTVREFIGTYRMLRASAARDRRDCWFEIDIENGRYRAVVYPYTDMMGNWVDAKGELLPEELVERIESRGWDVLDKAVSFRDVQAPGPNGNEVFDRSFFVHFRADGTIPPHIIHFVSRDQQEISLEIEEITGKIMSHDGYVELFSPQEQDFENLASGEGN
ncbi:MAG: prepilin-type N-terminal cleavage/methylation domain-containing protein [Planctomycetes bacterium]|nr:prepilin-type N-terminal cleavage/methylation domain-containing protein [Planctomycetota bacterium]